MENKFVTGDGFELGYNISDGKVLWFITLERCDSGNSIRVYDYETIESAFNLAKDKIEKLRS